MCFVRRGISNIYQTIIHWWIFTFLYVNHLLHLWSYSKICYFYFFSLLLVFFKVLYVNEFDLGLYFVKLTVDLWKFLMPKLQQCDSFIYWIKFIKNVWKRVREAFTTPRFLFKSFKDFLSLSFKNYFENWIINIKL